MPRGKYPRTQCPETKQRGVTCTHTKGSLFWYTEARTPYLVSFTSTLWKPSRPDNTFQQNTRDEATCFVRPDLGAEQYRGAYQEAQHCIERLSSRTPNQVPLQNCGQIIVIIRHHLYHTSSDPKWSMYASKTTFQRERHTWASVRHRLKGEQSFLHVTQKTVLTPSKLNSPLSSRNLIWFQKDALITYKVLQLKNSLQIPKQTVDTYRQSRGASVGGVWPPINCVPQPHTWSIGCKLRTIIGETQNVIGRGESTAIPPHSSRRREAVLCIATAAASPASCRAALLATKCDCRALSNSFSALPLNCPARKTANPSALFAVEK